MADYVQVCGFDLLEDEALADRHFMDVTDKLPVDWVESDNPGFAYYCYYVYANLVSLNHLRRYVKVGRTYPASCCFDFQCNKTYRCSSQMFLNLRKRGKARLLIGIPFCAVECLHSATLKHSSHHN